eukprot:scaffold53345_cov45-Attheya_sp.AAC.1
MTPFIRSAGTGCEILQPILDHLFSSTTTFSNKEKAFLVRDGNFVSGTDQQGNPLTLSPPVATVVDCSEQEAVSLLLRGYRLENVGITFQDHEVLKDVTWGVQTGDRIGLVGANGAGKTT